MATKREYSIFFGAYAFIIVSVLLTVLFGEYKTGDLFASTPDDWIAPDGRSYKHISDGPCGEQEEHVRDLMSDLHDGEDGAGNYVIHPAYVDSSATCYSGMDFRSGVQVYKIIEADRVRADEE